MNGQRRTIWLARASFRNKECTIVLTTGTFHANVIVVQLDVVKYERVFYGAQIMCTIINVC